jgi:flagellar M-ring protein FliF
MADTGYIDRFRSASVSQQVLLVGGTVALITLLAAVVWLFWLRTPYETLFRSLRPVDAATIVAELDRQKIPYRLTDGGSTILVPADKVDGTRLAVMSEDLPLKGTVGFELFNKSDMGLTDFAQKINYQRALQGELARTIMSLDGVEAARVHLSLGEDRVFRDDQVPPKASVTIRMRHGGNLSANAATGIQRLVAAAVPQLEVANVVILDEGGGIVNPQTHPGGEPLTPIAGEKQAVELYYESRIRAQLARVQPPYTPSVTVVAEVDLSTTGDRSLAGWTPGGRGFPLRITLVPAPGAQVEAEVRRAVAAAVDTNASLADTLAFSAIPPEAAASPASATPSAAPPTAAGSVPSGERHPAWLLAPVGLAIVALLLLIALRALRPSRLTPEECEEFAVRLREALEQEARARHV